ncbi:MAG: DinB family protein [Thermoanaerobaculia bacterium]
MKPRNFVVFAAVLCMIATAAVAQDPATVSPGNYKKLFENERVRVLEVTYKKGDESSMHSHPDHLAYVTSGGKLEFTLADGTKHIVEAKTGETIFVPAEAHSVKNVGKSTVRAVATELKEAAPSGGLDSAEREQLLELYARGQKELSELVANTTDEEWAKKPGPDRWSVSEVVEHLGAAESLLFGMAQQALAQPVSDDWALVVGGMSTDNFLGMLTNRGQKFQAPEPLKPHGGMSRADALAKFAGARAVTTDYVRRTDDLVKKHLADGPAGKMTVHQILVLIGGHNLRHNAQIREALEQLRAK